jgi:putative membrane protein (TIGR04086 family)
MLWGRIIAAGFAIEAILIALSIPLRLWVGQTPVTYVAVIGSFALPMLFGLWVGQRARSRRALHGFLIGAVATLIFLALSEAGRRWGPPAEPQPFAYLVAHGLKFLGGALGGFLADRQERQRDDAGRARAVTARYGG